MYFLSPYVALRAFLKMFWRGRKDKKDQERTAYKIAVLLGRDLRGRAAHRARA